MTPVPATRQVALFPVQSALRLARDKPTLLLFVHPQCPCTEASFRELDRLRAKSGNRAAVTVIFTIPKGVSPGWEEGSLWKSANGMPGVTVVRDRDGNEARRFGVVGSGHALLYDSSGVLLFSGGITGSRGHEGDNKGESAVVSLILGQHALVSHTPVFGCSLL